MRLRRESRNMGLDNQNISLMDGSSVQNYFKQETQAMIDAYRNFEILIPSDKTKGAQHRGEDGRFVENLLRSYLRKFLPRELEVLTGFIVRPAVKTDLNDKSRKKDSDKHSSQLDIIVYDSAKYPVFLRSEDTVIVPPEGVISIISVKKTLHDRDIEHEARILVEVSQMCSCKKLRMPFLALISMKNGINKKDTFGWIFEKLKGIYEEVGDLAFDDMLGYIGSMNEWSIFKRRPIKSNPCKADYILIEHKNNEEHFGLQFLLTGILSVYYDKTRNSTSRPGFTASPSGRGHDTHLGSIIAKKPASS